MEKRENGNCHPVYKNPEEFSRSLVDDILACCNKKVFHKSQSEEYKEIVFYNCPDLNLLSEVEENVSRQLRGHSFDISVFSLPDVTDIRKTLFDPGNGNYYGIDIGWFIEQGWLDDQEDISKSCQQA